MVLSFLLPMSFLSGWPSLAEPKSNASEAFSNYVEVRVGPYSACALTEKETVFCWGSLLGHQMPESFGPILRLGIVDTNYACVIDRTENLRCWWNKKIGYGWSSGGRAQKMPEFIARKPKDLGPILELVSAGEAEACAHKVDLTVSCWGLSPPVDLGKVSKLGEYRGGYCAVTLNHFLRCWGTSFWTRTSQLSSDGVLQLKEMNPNTEVTFDSRYDQVWAFVSGGNNLCFTKASDNKDVCVGSAPPIELHGETYVSDISLGDSQSCLIDSNAALYCWPSYGAPPTAKDGFLQVSVGEFVSCATTNQNKVVCWANTDYSNFGIKDLACGIPELDPRIDSIKETGTTGVSLNWKKSENKGCYATTVYVEKRLSGNRWVAAKLAGKTWSLITIAGLEQNRNYELRLRLKNRVGTSVYSPIFFVKTLSKCPYSIQAKITNSKTKVTGWKKSLSIRQKGLNDAWKKLSAALRERNRYPDYRGDIVYRNLVEKINTLEDRMADAQVEGDAGLYIILSAEKTRLQSRISSLFGKSILAEENVRQAEILHSRKFFSWQSASEALSEAKDELNLETSKCSIRE